LGGTPIRFIDFYRTCQPLTIRADHGSPQAMQPSPGRVVAPQAQNNTKGFTAVQNRSGVSWTSSKAQRKAAVVSRKGLHQADMLSKIRVWVRG
jgi:hypothetical protein